MKRLITSMLIVLLISVAFIGSFYKGYYCYAEDINYMSDAELEAAYQAYLQSKGGGLLGNAGARLAYTNGKMLNFLTSEYNTTPYKNINQVKGLMSWERAELESGNSSVLQLSIRHPEVFSLYTQWLLQNHYFGDGVTDSDGLFDDGVDNNLYSGYFYSDSDGKSCLVWVMTPSFYGSHSYINKSTFDTLVSKRGSSYGFTQNQLISYVQSGTLTNNYIGTFPTLNISANKSVNMQYKVFSSSTESRYAYFLSNQEKGTFYYLDNNVQTRKDSYPILYVKADSNGVPTGYLYLGTYTERTNGYYDLYEYSAINYFSNLTNNYNSVNVNFYTNNNNNVVVYPSIDADGTLYIRPKVKINGEYKPYIVNEGDSITNVVNNYYNDSGEKDNTITEPSDQPSGSGGGSGGSGGNSPNWGNPFPSLSPDGNGGFNFNFTLPDLNIDWNINGLTEKFPFSIPFDLINFITILNAEPETPHYEGTVNLIVYQWNIDADLSDFDNLAGIVRNVEFIGFCITLILITRRMIKG